ncbi:MAG: retroviral-like aspartic protease family protein [Pirellulaceae bacterium]|nr:retroviral-like aspartic protease family protein [Pirellulaceae bacterium]
MTRASTAGEKTEKGRIALEVELTNYEDKVRARNGDIPPEKVRRIRIDAIVDTGAAHLVIPQSAADALGVPVIGEAGVRYADESRAKKKIVNAVEVSLLSRSGIFRAIVEPARTEVLLGAIVLEDMDFIVDCRAQKLVPRDPEMIQSEIE